MTFDPPRLRCQCGWVGPLTDLLFGYNPFADGDVIKGCPSCRAIIGTCAADVDYVCQFLGCDLLAEGGTPLGDGGYALVCDRHWDTELWPLEVCDEQ